MSIILNIGKKSVKTLKEGKKSKSKQKSGCKTPGPPCSSSSYQPTATTMVWNHTLDGQRFSLAFCKNTMNLWCNDKMINTDTEFSDSGTERAFVIASRKGCLRIRKVSEGEAAALGAVGGAIGAAAAHDGLSYEMYIDGHMVPHANQNR